MVPIYRTLRIHRCPACSGPTVREADVPTYEQIVVQKRTELAVLLDGTPERTWRFFETIFRVENEYSQAKQVARDLGLLPTTLMSRFHRLELPAPKGIVTSLWLWRVILDLESTGRSINVVSLDHGASSSQSAGRTCRTIFGDTFTNIMKVQTADEIYQTRFLDVYITPYLDKWKNAVVLPDGRASINEETRRMLRAS